MALFTRLHLLHVHFRNILALGLIFAGLVLTGFAQSDAPAKPADEKAKKADSKKEQQSEAVPAANSKDPKAPVTAEAVAESAIVIYGGFGGRQKLDQIRKTSIERGKMSLVNAQGTTEPVSYETWSIRG